jgi:hypothetical protein
MKFIPSRLQRRPSWSCVSEDLTTTSVQKERGGLLIQFLGGWDGILNRLRKVRPVHRYSVLLLAIMLVAVAGCSGDSAIDGVATLDATVPAMRRPLPPPIR